MSLTKVQSPGITLAIMMSYCASRHHPSVYVEYHLAADDTSGAVASKSNLG